MTQQQPADTPLPRRGFHRLALIALAALLNACRPQPAPVTPTPRPTVTPRPTPLPTEQPSPTAAPSIAPSPPPDPTASPTPGDGAARAIYEEHRARIAAILADTPDHHVRLLVRPLDHPHLQIAHRSDEYHRSASTIKALILIYALLKDPALDLRGRTADRPPSDAYRMIVSSHNGATARVLAAAAGEDARDEALDLFNACAHEVLGLPPTMGLTQWDYWPTTGARSQIVSEPQTADFPTGVPNPISLDALADFYTLLGTPDALAALLERAADRYAGGYASHAAYIEAAGAAIEAAKALLAIPDPDYVTQMEIALEAARAAHPAIMFEMYGKNGTLSPADWDLKRWQINEGVLLTLRQGGRAQKFAAAFSSASFNTSAYLNAALDYCAALFAAG
jgi:hypothetical protein